MFYDPLGIPFTSTAGNGVQGQDACSLQYTDVSGDFEGDWSTANSAIATVDYYGTHTGQGLGSTTSSTFAEEEWHVSNYSCPITNRFAGGGDNVKPSITVHFTGNLTTGDNLSFSNVAQTCSSTLGLKNCSNSYPSAWVWNVEVEGIVDNAANYMVSQGVAGLTKGFYKDSSGTLHSFSLSTNKPAPQDNPPSGVLQQSAGQKTIFWLDAPGRGTIYTDPNNSANTGPIDSMTDVNNFTSSICTTATPITCYPVSWYIKIVINSGASLDTTNSAAGFGSLPLNF